MFKYLIPGFIILLANCSTIRKSNEEINENFGRVIDSCSVTKPTKKVYVFKQWHLSPSVDTTTITSQSLPQERNQTAIFSQIESWIQNKTLDTIIAEGCEGEINEQFETKYNGWNYELLKNHSQVAGYNHVISHIPLKLAAKYGNQIKVLCGDSNELIEKSNLALSDIRGLTGFTVRLKEFAEYPEKQKSYLAEVIKLFKLPKDATVEVADRILKDEIRSSIGQIKDHIVQRDDVFVKKIRDLPSEKMALVIGGAHADDIKYKLQKNNIGCDIIEPIGYDFDPDAMFRKALGE